MNTRLFALASAASLLALAACTTTTDTSGSGGSGGDASTTDTSTTTTSTTTAGGSSGGGACISCADYLADQSLDVSSFCEDNGPPTSGELFDAIGACACTACETECGDNLCMGLDGTDECNACVTNSVLTPNASGGCNDEFVACSNDA